MKDLDYRKFLIEGFIHLIFEIIKDIVVVMPLGAIICLIIMIVSYLVISLLYNNFKNS